MRGEAQPRLINSPLLALRGSAQVFQPCISGAESAAVWQSQPKAAQFISLVLVPGVPGVEAAQGARAAAENQELVRMSSYNDSLEQSPEERGADSRSH